MRPDPSYRPLTRRRWSGVRRAGCRGAASGSWRVVGQSPHQGARHARRVRRLPRARPGPGPGPHPLGRGRQHGCLACRTQATGGRAMTRVERMTREQWANVAVAVQLPHTSPPPSSSSSGPRSAGTPRTSCATSGSAWHPPTAPTRTRGSGRPTRQRTLHGQDRALDPVRRASTGASTPRPCGARTACPSARLGRRRRRQLRAVLAANTTASEEARP